MARRKFDRVYIGELETATAKLGTVVEATAGAGIPFDNPLLFGAGPWFDVTHPSFAGGAKGDRETDDTAAVTACFAACRDAGGGIVVFPGGKTYFFRGTVPIYSNTWVIAHGATFTAALDGTTNATKVFDASGTQGTARAVTALASENGYTLALSAADTATFSAKQHVWVFDSASYFTLQLRRERNIIQTTSAAGVQLRYPLNFAYPSATTTLSALTPVERVRWDGGTFDLYQSAGEVDAIQFAWATHCVVRDVEVTRHGGKGVQFWDSLACHTENIRVTNPTSVTAGRGYGVQFIYDRHCTATDTYGENCRHTVDVSGGSDHLIRSTRAVGDSSVAPATAIFLHGVQSKRVLVDGFVIALPNTASAGGTGCSGFGAGNGSFDGDFDAMFRNGLVIGATAGCLITQNCARIAVESVEFINCGERALAADNSSDLVVRQCTGRITQTAFGGYGMFDFAACSRVRVDATSCSGAIADGYRFYNCTDVAINLDGAWVEGSTNRAVHADLHHGYFRLTGGTLRQNSPVASPTIEIVGVDASVLVSITKLACYGGATQPAAHIKVWAATPTIRDVELVNAGEPIRCESTGTPVIAGAVLDNCNNGVRLEGAIGAAIIERDVVYRNVAQNPVFNNAGAKLLRGTSANKGDADSSYTFGVDEETILHNSVYTANRTTTLNHVSASRVDGMLVRVVRGPAGTGSFNHLVKDSSGTTIATLTAAGQAATCQWVAAVGAWVLAA